MNIAGKLILGRYQSQKTFIHSFDSRIKFLFFFIISVSLFLSGYRKEIYIAHFFLLVSIVLISRIAIKKIINGMIPMFWLVFLTIVFHLLIPPNDIVKAVYISLRLLIMFTWASLLTLSTSLNEIGSALSWYSSVLRYIKIKSRDVVIIFILAIRFFPVVLEEAESIINVQKARNHRLGFFKRVEVFLVAFLIRMFNRADSFAKILKSKGLEDYFEKKYSTYRTLGIRDFCALILALFVLGTAVFL